MSPPAWAAQHRAQEHVRAQPGAENAPRIANIIRYQIPELLLTAVYQQSARTILVLLPICAFAICDQFGLRRVPPPSLEGLKGVLPRALPCQLTAPRYVIAVRGAVLFFGIATGGRTGPTPRRIKPLLPNSLEPGVSARTLERGRNRTREPRCACALQSAHELPTQFLACVRQGAPTRALGAMRGRRTVS